MPNEKLPSQQELRMLLNYDHQTGMLTWRKRDISLFDDGGHGAAHNRDKWNGRWAGKEAFTARHGAGYRHGAINGKPLLAHRVIWKWMTGIDPVEVDHTNGTRADNRWSNLRSVPHSENMRNAARHKDNSSGIRGVRLVNRKNWKGWQAFIYNNSKFISLGSFENIDDAVAARKQGEIKYGYHKNHGR